MEAHGQASGYSTAHHAAAGLPEVTVAEQLQDLVLDSTDVSDFLLELSEYSALLAGTGVGHVDCAVTLYGRRKALTGAGNTARARSLNSIQERLGTGPCLSALQEEQTVVINDLANDPRWPDYARALLAENIRSVLTVPLVLEQGASASLNFFSTTPHNFHAGIVRSAEQYARQA
ncbi:GAF domain-containing protein [Specibacter sp. NPDC057265]|uniref:GAF domain-containing protein n=1 Tax=Specibacter sp. NPDC057265 TaxID=3346075 RepID=UPI0036289DC5